MRWPRLWEKRVRGWGWGEDKNTYIRFTPNAGIGFVIPRDGRHRVAISVRRGIEYFELGRRQQWVRVKCWLSPMHAIDPAQRKVL